MIRIVLKARGGYSFKCCILVKASKGSYLSDAINEICKREYGK
jgi:hypothetical protein